MSQSSVLSTEYLKVPVTFTVAGADIDPTGDPVQVALPVHGTDPVSGDWVTGSWEVQGSTRWARILIGPGAKVLAKGTYDVWVKVTDSPEVPALKGGTHIVY
jgi:hypothetical protein